MATSNIKKINIDVGSIIRANDTKERLQRAIIDLTEGNVFYIKDKNELNELNIKLVENKFVIEVVSNCQETNIVVFPLSPLRRVIKDYRIICDNYYDSVRVSDSRKIEAIDMSRRGVHNEGSEIIEDLISNQINSDFETLRKLFSVVFILQIK